MRSQHYAPGIPQFGRFPVLYGSSSSYTTVTAETVYIYGVPHPIQGRAWGATLSTDGYGTLRIPGHALQCLRVRVIENVIGTRYKAFWFITREGALFYVETTTDYPDTGNVLASSYTSVVGSGLVGVNGETIRPTRFSLQQNYPNPFNPTTIIRYELPESDHVLLRVFDLLGRQVRTLVDGRENAGAHDIELNATGMSSGVYIYRLQAGPFAETKKLIVLR